MEKKNLVAIVAAMMIACISFISFFTMSRFNDVRNPEFNNRYPSDINDEEFELKSDIYNVGYTDGIHNRTIVVSKRSELEKFMNNFMNKSEVLDKYDDDYFEDKSLALIYETTSNSAISIKVNSLEIVGKSLQIDYSRESSSEIGAAVMGGYLIVVEVPSSVTGIGN